MKTKIVPILLVLGVFILLGIGFGLRTSSDSDTPDACDVEEYTTEEDVDDTPTCPTLMNSELPLPCFTRVIRNFEKNKNTTCSLSIDYPEDAIPNALGICRWLVGLVNDELESISGSNDFVPYVGNPKDKEALAKFYSERYFAMLDTEFYNGLSFYDFSMSAYVQNARYVTYFLYARDYRGGGAHPYYADRLASFDLNTSKEITPEYLFRPDCLNKVKIALLAVVLKDGGFPCQTIEDVLCIFLCDWSNLGKEESSIEDESFQSRLSYVDISRMGLTPEGVDVSFFPHELGCVAAGCFHFLIPYKDIYSYLSDAGKRCVGTL